MVVMRALSESPAILTVSAAGAWCKKMSKSALKEAIDGLSLEVPPCECVHQEELQRFTDKFGSLFFTYSFHVEKATSRSVEAELSKIQKCLHRLSLVHAQVKIISEIRTDSTTRKQMFSGGEKGSKVSAMDHSITMDTAAYGQSPFSVRCLPSCPQMHPVLGNTMSCVLPSNMIEAGLCGEMSMATMATLAPCMNLYSNWPTRLSCIRMLVYSPCGMPLMQQTQPSFLQSLATSLSWADLGLSRVCCMEAQNIQGSLCSEVEFSVETDCSQETRCSSAVQQDIESEWSHAVEQTLTVFVFTQYTDPFHSQISDFIGSEEVFERHLDAILWYNGDQVRATLQTTMKNTLKGFQQKHAARQRLGSAIPIVLSSMNSIIASSSSGEFRRACFDSMKVKSTSELHASLKQSLQSIVAGRFTPRHRCNKEKVVEAVSTEQSSLDGWEEENPPELSSKRIHSELQYSSFTPTKRQHSEMISENSDTFMNNVFEAANIQRNSLSPIQLPQSQQTRMIADKPSVLSLTNLKNEQVEKQWLQELENFSEWDWIHCVSPGLATERMFPCLAHRPWQVLCRVYLQQRATLSQRPSKIATPCFGWKSGGGVHKLWFSFPDSRVTSLMWTQVQYCSTSGSDKTGSPAGPVEPKPTEKEQAAQSSAKTAGSKTQGLTKAESIQVKVRAVLKKREYGTKYTQNNFITAVRAMNEFCLKPSDLEQLRKIRRRSPHDDTEAFTVFLRSDVEAKALDVWGSQEALARERNLRKDVEREYQENIFRNQKLLKEYKDFWGNTKPRSRKRATFLQGPGKVVMVAICINGLNFFFKLLAWVYTGSASMFSEAIHSLADTCNQALLVIGISQSVRNPDAVHPYGFSNMRYIASLISGVGIFMMGAGLSWYHGIMGLLHPQPIESLLWAYCILAGSLVSEGATLLVAINEIKKSAREQGLSFYEYVMQSRDPSTNVVLLEDAAAVLGVVMAAGCMGLTSLTGNPYYDSLGSLGVGTLLGTVSAFLIYTNTEALLGRSIQAEHVQKLTEFLENDPAVRAIHDVKATDMGLSKVRFKAEVDFDGRVVTRSYLEKQDIEQILNDIQQVKTPEELENFMLKHGENIIDTLGAEVDRLEKELKQRNPEVRHVDLEIL
ncbi:zinc transporter 9-like [Sinocyclocheilus anshuiensis]|nr:PREDICTED: zinc transporter 9-like [Sinocyclocheilus anshuiensis]